MNNKDDTVDKETLGKIAKDAMTRNKHVFDRLAEI